MESICSLEGFLVKALTTGTITMPPSIAKAPQLIGLCSTAGKLDLKNMLASMSTEPQMKHAMQLALVVFFQYRL